MHGSAHKAPSPHHWAVRVYFEDTDCGGVVYHTGYLRFMERARTEWLRELGHDQGRIRVESGLLFVVREIAVRYRQPAVLDDELMIATTVTTARRTRLLFDQVIRHTAPPGHACCTARVEVVCMDAGRGRPRPLPDWILTEPLDVR